MTTPDGAPAAERLLVVGEALIDIVRERSGPSREHVGGSPANVSLGLGRLGRAVSLLTQIGTDPYADMITSHLQGSGVEILPGSASARRTSTALADLAEDGSAQYTFDLDWSLREADVPFRPLAVHTGSIGALLAPGATTVRSLVDRLRESSTVTFDPNVRPALLGSAADARDTVEDLVAGSDVVKASDEDLAWLYPGVGVEEVAATWLESGASVVAVTLGAAGSLATARSGPVRLASIDVQVVDTVGAGDAFMSGLLDALWTQELLGARNRQALRSISPSTLEWCLRRAALVAAITVSRPGAQPPTSQDLDEWP